MSDHATPPPFRDYPEPTEALLADPAAHADRVEDCDVVVVGLGPGGETAAGLLGRELDVVGVEEHLVGGECPFYGCVPSKMMIAAAHGVGAARRAAGDVGTAEVHPHLERVMPRVHAEAVHGWDDTSFVERLEKNGARLLRGRGRLVGPRQVLATAPDGATTLLRARRGVVLNPGTRPMVPPVDGLAGTPYWTNREVFAVDAAPASMAVVGGGPIGVELAQTFARFGTAVTLVEVAERILGPEEPEAAPIVADALAADGVQLLEGCDLRSVRHADGCFHLDVGGQDHRVERVLVATGRVMNTDDLGLDAVGVEPDGAGQVATDAWCRVQGPDGPVDGLWAVGDVTGRGAFTHLSNYQARVAVRDVLGQGGPPADYRAVPRVTYADPEVGSVGLTEQQARDAGIDVDVATSDLAARGWLEQRDGLVKLVADHEAGVLVGACVVAPPGGEVLSMLVTAVQQRTPVEDLKHTIFAYPTWHKAVESALHRLGRDRR